MLCPACGADVLVADQTCQRCGFALTTERDDAPRAFGLEVSDAFKSWGRSVGTMVRRPEVLGAVAAAVVAQALLQLTVVQWLASALSSVQVPTDIGQSTSTLLARGSVTVAFAIGLDLALQSVPWIPLAAVGIWIVRRNLGGSDSTALHPEGMASSIVHGAQLVLGIGAWLFTTLMLMWAISVVGAAGIPTRAMSALMVAVLVAVMAAVPLLLVGFAASPHWTTLLRPWKPFVGLRDWRLVGIAAAVGGVVMIGSIVAQLVVETVLGFLGGLGGAIAAGTSFLILLPYLPVLVGLLKRAGLHEAW